MYFFDKSIKIDGFNINDFGFLVGDAIILRTGNQKYLGEEVGDSSQVAVVHRSKEEAFGVEALQSYTNLPVTDGHPKEFVTVKNIKELSKGTISKVEVVDLGDGIFGAKTQICITDLETVEKVISGTVELSIGFGAEIVKEDGIFGDEEYQYAQKNIIGNHVALVPKGRCGEKCSIIKDEKNIIAHKTIKEGENLEELQAEIASLKEQIETLKGEKEALTAGMKDKEEKMKEAGDVAILSQTAQKMGVSVEAGDSSFVIRQKLCDHIGIKHDGQSIQFMDGAISLRVQMLEDGKTAYQQSIAQGNQTAKPTQSKFKGADSIKWEEE